MAEDPTDSTETHAAQAEPAAGVAPSIGVWARIREHKIAQWTLAYAAAAYAMLDGTKIASDAFDWPHQLLRIVMVLLILGLPLVVTLAWFHGHRALRRVSGAELTIITVLLAVAGAVLWRFARAPQETLITKAAVVAQAPVAARADAISDKSIAVLPFVDMSEKRDQEYFGDGMAEEILNLLAKLPNLKVIGRTSSFQFKGKADDLRQVGSTLGAHYIVAGSVRRSGDQLRIAAQLIDARDGTQRWTHTYDRTAKDAFAVQTEIAASLVRALQVEVASFPKRVSPRSSDAYDHYLRGLHSVDRFDEQGFNEAIAEFRRALDSDPAFAPAAERLAKALYAQADWGFVPADKGYNDARTAALAALKLDPGSADAHTLIGMVHIEYDWDWPAAENELKTALTLSPNHPNTLVALAQLRLALGQWSDAARLIDAALVDDPLDASWQMVRSWCYQRLDRLADSEDAARRVLDIAPTYVGGHSNLALVLRLEGKLDAALAELQKEPEPESKEVGLIALYQALHKTNDAEAALARLKGRALWEMGLAYAYSALGRSDPAFQWLEKAHAIKDAELYLIKGDPRLKSLEQDPRYKTFLLKMKLL